MYFVSISTNTTDFSRIIILQRGYLQKLRVIDILRYHNSVISLRSVLFVDETGTFRENHWSTTITYIHHSIADSLLNNTYTISIDNPKAPSTYSVHSTSLSFKCIYCDCHVTKKTIYNDEITVQKAIHFHCCKYLRILEII